MGMVYRGFHISIMDPISKFVEYKGLHKYIILHRRSCISPQTSVIILVTIVIDREKWKVNF